MFDRQTIIRLYESGNPFREVAVDAVLADFAIHGDLFFSWFSAAEPLLVNKASGELWFLNTGLPCKATATERKAIRIFPRMAALYDAFMRILEERLPYHPCPDRLLRDLYSSFPGIREELEARHPGCRREFPDESLRRQLMVFVCGQCNLHCPYCFSHDLAKKEISEADLRQIFAWASREGCGTVTPCGGEPLLYSRLELFLDLIREYGMTTYLASNFTVDISGIKGFTSDVVRRLYVHFTRESLGDTRMRHILDYNIDLCKRLQIDMTARVNLTVPDEKAALGWIDLTKDKGIKRLNIALTIPSRYGANSYTSPDDFKAYVPTICRMVSHARERGIALGIAKPLPLCLFPEETAATLMRADANAALCGIHQSGYMNNLSLSTDMAFSPCLGLTDERVDFNPSLTWQELSARFAPCVRKMLLRPVMKDCGHCFLYDRGLCQGFCLSYKYRADEDF